MRFIIGRETWLNDFGAHAASYFLEIKFEQIYAEDTTEDRLGMIFVTW